MREELILFLCGLFAFLVPLLVQLPLCTLAEGLLRQGGLLFSIGWLLAALAVLSVDETSSPISLGPYLAGLLLALAGYSLARAAYYIHRKRK